MTKKSVFTRYAEKRLTNTFPYYILIIYLKSNADIGLKFKAQTSLPHAEKVATIGFVTGEFPFYRQTGYFDLFFVFPIPVVFW